jgi:hypothetical protein
MMAVAVAVGLGGPGAAAAQGAEGGAGRGRDGGGAAARLTSSASRRADAEPWVLDDGVGPAEVRWDDFDPAASYAPRGRPHLGAQLRGGALLGEAPPAPEGGPWLEAGIFFDLRYAPRSPWHLRLVAAFSLQPTGQGRLARGGSAESSAFAIRMRALPLSVDLGDWIAFRAGGGMMLGWVTDFAGGGSFEARPEAAGELVVRLFAGRFEVGIFGGTTYTLAGEMGGFVRDSFQGLLGVSAGYVVR